MWNIGCFHRDYRGESRPRFQVALEFIQYVRLSAGHHLDRPIRQVPREARQLERFGPAPHRPPEAHALHPPPHDPAPDRNHA